MKTHMSETLFFKFWNICTYRIHTLERAHRIGITCDWEMPDMGAREEFGSPVRAGNSLNHWVIHPEK